MDEEILQMLRERAEEEKKQLEEIRKSGNPPVEFTLLSGETSSLEKMIKTNYQAELFMKLLRSM
jgi:hypothetical protein